MQYQHRELWFNIKRWNKAPSLVEKRAYDTREHPWCTWPAEKGSNSKWFPHFQKQSFNWVSTLIALTVMQKIITGINSIDLISQHQDHSWLIRPQGITGINSASLTLSISLSLLPLSLIGHSRANWFDSTEQFRFHRVVSKKLLLLVEYPSTSKFKHFLASSWIKTP